MWNISRESINYKKKSDIIYDFLKKLGNINVDCFVKKISSYTNNIFRYDTLEFMKSASILEDYEKADFTRSKRGFGRQLAEHISAQL